MEASSTVLNYLGHPCRIAALAERVGSIEAIRHDDPRGAAQQFARGLYDQIDRTSHLHEVLEHLAGLSSSLPDGEELNSMLAVLTEYAIGTANAAFDLGARAIVLMENATAAQSAEVAHG